MPVANKMP